MSAELAIAGVAWLVLAFGHTAIGVRWVLPALEEVRLPGTPFGGPSFTRSMLWFTWHIVGVLLLGFGVLFLVLALAPHADVETLLLRWVAGVLLAATALAFWQVRRNLRASLRLPVPFVLVAIAVLCVAAST